MQKHYILTQTKMGFLVPASLAGVGTQIASLLISQMDAMSQQQAAARNQGENTWIGTFPTLPGAIPLAAVYNPYFDQSLMNSTKFASNICLYIDFPLRSLTRIPSDILKLCDKNSTICCSYDVTNKQYNSPKFIIAAVNHTIVTKTNEQIESICKEKLSICQSYCCHEGG